jgi:hypothetical protein
MEPGAGQTAGLAEREYDMGGVPANEVNADPVPSVTVTYTGPPLYDVSASVVPVTVCVMVVPRVPVVFQDTVSGGVRPVTFAVMTPSLLHGVTGTLTVTDCAVPVMLNNNITKASGNSFFIIVFFDD